MKTSSVYVNERENIAEAMNLNEDKLSTICDKVVDKYSKHPLSAPSLFLQMIIEECDTVDEVALAIYLIMKSRNEQQNPLEKLLAGLMSSNEE